MTETVEAYADYSIRKALGFAGLGIGMVMLSLSFDLALALRAGADLLACVLAGLLVAAWRAPGRNMRHSELFVLLADQGHRPGGASPRPWAARMRDAAWQRVLSETLRRRLLWHADRVAATALALWLLSLPAGFVAS